MISPLIRRWLRFWFEPTPPARLAFSRALFYASLLICYSQEDFSLWGGVSNALWMPLPLFSALHLDPLQPFALGVLQAVWRIALALCSVGLFTRVSMIVAAALGFYLLGLPHNFGHTFHVDALLVIAMTILACSRAGDAYSIDALLARGARRHTPAASGEYTWPIRMIWLAMSLVFLAAGIAKLRWGGVAWITSDNLRIVLMRAVYHVSDADPWTDAGLWIAARPWLTHVLAGSAVLIELAFIASLFHPVARAVCVPAAFFLLVGIRALMGPRFAPFMVAYVFWVPWDVPAGYARKLLAVKRSAVPSLLKVAASRTGGALPQRAWPTTSLMAADEHDASVERRKGRDVPEKLVMDDFQP
jgi:hypothetical protein